MTQRFSHRRRAAYVATVWFLCALGCLIVIANQGDLLPVPVTGNQFDASGRIVSIAPHSAAADAGLHVGDRIDRMQFLSRSTKFTFTRGSTRLTTTVVPRCCAPAPTRTAFGVLQDVENIVGLIATLVIAAWLVSVRPGLMTLGLFLAMLNFPTIVWSPFLPEWANRAVVAVSSFVTFNGLWAGLLLFALRFPNDKVEGWRVAAQRWSVGALVLMQALVTIGAVLVLTHGTFMGDYAAFELFLHTSGVWSAAFMLLAAIILCVRYAESDPVLRAQIGWALCGIIIALADGIYVLFGGVAIGYQLNGAWALIVVALPGCAAYALLRTRFIDLSFALSRATVLSIVGGVIALVVATVDFLTRRYLSSSNLTLIINAGISIALGFSLNALRRKVESGVDRLLFRHRYTTAVYLDRLGRSFSASRNPATIERALTVLAPDAMQLASAALFRLDAGRRMYVRVAQSSGWAEGQLSQLDVEDELVRFLQAHREPVTTNDARWSHPDVPSGPAQPATAIPIIIGDDLEAFVLYGSHRNRSGIDDDERQELAALCERASIAFVHIEAAVLQDELAESDRRYAALLERLVL